MKKQPRKTPHEIGTITSKKNRYRITGIGQLNDIGARQSIAWGIPHKSTSEPESNKRQLAESIGLDMHTHKKKTPPPPQCAIQIAQ